MPYIAIAIGIIALSLTGIFVKLSSAESAVIAFYRMLFSVLVMSPVFLLKYKSELKLLQKRDYFFSVVAVVFLAFYFIL